MRTLNHDLVMATKLSAAAHYANTGSYPAIVYLHPLDALEVAHSVPIQFHKFQETEELVQLNSLIVRQDTQLQRGEVRCGSMAEL